MTIILNWRFVKMIDKDSVYELQRQILDEHKKDDKERSKKLLYNAGYIVWSTSDRLFKTYDVNLPTDWETLKQFCRNYGINTESFEKQLASNDPNLYLSIPFIIAIKRPKKIIGFSGDIEFINFHISLAAADVSDGKIIRNVEVKFKQHKQPLTVQRAKEISGFSANFNKLSLVAGCGALGSKIVLHLAKSGTTSFVLSDPDWLWPHNFVRHSVSAENVDYRKASYALKKEISAIYPDMKLQSCTYSE